jgi:hypothetical protein
VDLLEFRHVFLDVFVTFDFGQEYVNGLGTYAFRNFMEVKMAGGNVKAVTPAQRGRDQL